METTPFILKEYKAFSPQTKINEVKLFFSKTIYTHFPIVNNNELIGLISETDIQGIHKGENELQNYAHLFSLFFIEETNNLLDILKVFALNDANLIPVVNNQNQYLGYYDLIEVLHLYKNAPFINNVGVTLLLEKEISGYSFSEICQIVESNNGKLLGLFIADSNETFVKITLKFSSQDVNEIIQSFRRYNYKVLSKHKEDFYLEDLKERTEYLQKYLNI